MSQFVLSVTCRSRPMSLILGCTTLMLPLWAIAAPVWFVLLIAVSLRIPGILAPDQMLVFLLGLFSFTVGGAILTALCEDDKINIDSEGLSFPLRFLPDLRFKRYHCWSQLDRIHVQERSVEKDFDGRLVLFFRDSGFAIIDSRQMSRSDLQLLLMSVDLWAKRCENHLEIADLRRLTSGQCEYSRLLDEELANRFRPLGYRPLAADTYMQGGKLRILRQLSCGGFAATYLAHLDGRSIVLLKETAPKNQTLHSTGNERASLEAFQRERRILGALNHRGLSLVYDHFVENDRQYLVLAYKPGASLWQIVRENGPFAEWEVIDILLGVCDILKYLHGLEPAVLHLDLTPENLILDCEGRVHLIDFGAAQFAGEAEAISGKEGYMAPEQIEGRPLPASDIYGLGVTGLFLLRGGDHISMKEALSGSKLESLLLRCSESSFALRPPVSELSELLLVLKKPRAEAEVLR